jgi:hypothetical protein
VRPIYDRVARINNRDGHPRRKFSAASDVAFVGVVVFGVGAICNHAPRSPARR